MDSPVRDRFRSPCGSPLRNSPRRSSPRSSKNKGQNVNLEQRMSGFKQKPQNITYRGQNKKYQDMNNLQDYSTEISEKFKMVKDYEMNEKDRKIITKYLENHYFFSNITEETINLLISKMIFAYIESRNYVYKDNDNAMCFFIIQEGEVSVEIDKNQKRSLKKGASFGEQALQYNLKRTQSVRAEKKTHFWILDRFNFKSAIEEITSSQFIENRAFIDTLPIFIKMTDLQKDSISYALLSQSFQDGEYLTYQGEKNNLIFIIKEGIVELTDQKNGTLKMLKNGDSFEEMTFEGKYGKSSINQIAKAVGPVNCIVISKSQIENISGESYTLVTQKNDQREILKNHENFKKLTDTQIEKWVKNSDFVTAKKGDKIYLQEDKLDRQIVFLNGSARSNEESRIYDPGMIFGDEQILRNDNQDSETIVNTDLVMNEDGLFSTLEVNKLFQFLYTKNLEREFKKNEISKGIISRNINENYKEELYDVRQSDLIYIKKLGEGSFGHVYLVHNKIDGKLYALKACSKAQIVNKSIEKYTCREKNVLDNLNHPLIIKLYKTFRDQNFVYFLTDFIHGEELFDSIRVIDLQDNKQSAFYVASIILAIEYLHSQNIVHRDIKPENLMVEASSGRLKLIDFGTAKILSDTKSINRTYTTLGTPHYMAPEMLLGKGYGPMVDIWSMGICMYEFLCGQVPYGEHTDDSYEVYELILSEQIEFPEYISTNGYETAMSQIYQLLSRFPDLRIKGSYASLKSHEWFDLVDWDSLIEGECTPPYLPQKTAAFNDAEIKERLIKNVSVDKEILKYISQFKKGITRTVGVDKNWDKEF